MHIAYAYPEVTYIDILSVTPLLRSRIIFLAGQKAGPASKCNFFLLFHYTVLEYIPREKSPSRIILAFWSQIIQLLNSAKELIMIIFHNIFTSAVTSVVGVDLKLSRIVPGDLDTVCMIVLNLPSA
jgi:hypothetical protein